MLLPLVTITSRKRNAGTQDTYVVVEPKKVKEEIPLPVATASADEVRASVSEMVVLDILNA